MSRGKPCGCSQCGAPCSSPPVEPCIAAACGLLARHRRDRAGEAVALVKQPATSDDIRPCVTGEAEAGAAVEALRITERRPRRSWPVRIRTPLGDSSRNSVAET